MKRISRSLSNFTSPGSVESFSSGVTTEKRSTCMPSKSTHKARLWLPSVYKVTLRVMRGLLRLHIIFVAVSPFSFVIPWPKKWHCAKKVCHGAKFTLSVGGGFWQKSHIPAILDNKSLDTLNCLFPSNTFTFLSRTYYFFQISQPAKICLKNRYFEEQIHWVPLTSSLETS